MEDQLVNLTVEKAFKAAYSLALAVDSNARGVDTCFVKFCKGESGKDTALMRFGVKRHWFYFMYPNFGYYQTPSQVHFALVMRKYKTTLGGLLKPLKSTSVGYKWNYAKNDSLYYFQ
jgi:hypothetical protein